MAQRKKNVDIALLGRRPERIHDLGAYDNSGSGLPGAGIRSHSPAAHQISANRITVQGNGDEVDGDAAQIQLFGMGPGRDQWEPRQRMALGKLLQTT